MLMQSSPQFHTVSYRNGIYQGYFSKQTETRESFGLIFTTDNHLVMGSHWLNDQANQATFVYYNHGCYVYGFWNNSVPHGFNAVRMDKIVIFAIYDRGVVDGRMLMIYEQYNTAIVLERGEGEGQFTEIQKGEVYSDQDFKQYAEMCKWPEFNESWKTLIKFISANFTQEKGPKNQIAKLRLINGTCYRYGYDQGIAIVFDDEYRIISAGLHRKANLKSLGVRFTKESFVQQGNFSSESQVLAFNFGHRPDNKMGKIYTNYLLKSNEFVNKFLTNPAKILISNLQQLIKSNLFRKLLAGQITTRKLDISYASPQSSDRKQLEKWSSKKKEKDQFYHELEEQKKRLEIYKKQLNDSINRRSRVVERGEPQIDYSSDKEKKSNRIIHKALVQLATRTQYQNQKNHRSKSKNNRSPIFTPDRNDTRQVSPSRVSPFGQKMRNRIFKDRPTSQNKSKKYVYEPIQELYPKHTDVSPISKNVSIQNYNSPHQQLHLSNQKIGLNDGNSAVVPVLMRNQKIENPIQNDRLRGNNNRQNGTKQRLNQPAISFRDPSLIASNNNNNKPQYKNQASDNFPNIVISNPSRSRSPATRKHFAAEALQFEAKNKKNDVYFRDTVQQPASQQSNKKEIKGNTYLEKYQRTKQITPEKASLSPQINRYNKTIKGFNQNNKIYQKIQSPPRQEQPKNDQLRQNRNDQLKNNREHRPDRSQQPQRKPSNIAQYQRQYQQDAITRKGGKNQINMTTPTRKKYQYVFN